MSYDEPLPVSYTQGQVKKHFSQMTFEEIEFLWQKIAVLGEKLHFSYHLKSRIDTKSINLDTFKTAILLGNFQSIIEYNLTKKQGKTSKRVLFRDFQPVWRRFHKRKIVETEGWANLCFVVDIETGTIITAYYNLVDDDHFQSMDWSRYDSSLNIIESSKPPP